MIKIDFQEPTSEQWQEWRQECDDARDELVKQVESGKKPKVTELYKDLRMQSIYKSQNAPFFGKCAYCESDVLVNQPGDIEHWRPKSRVTDEKGRAIEINSGNGEKTPHPGYYWLAYDSRNLLLSCATCNRPSTSKISGRRIGKWDQFPVEDFRATIMGEESQESPILLNPVEEDPADHLEVDDEGFIIAKTYRGQLCIDIFGLNIREALLDARRKYINDTRWLIGLLINSIRSQQHNKNDAMGKLVEIVQDIKSGSAPYSACGRLILREFESKL